MALHQPVAVAVDLEDSEETVVASEVAHLQLMELHSEVPEALVEVDLVEDLHPPSMDHHQLPDLEADVVMADPDSEVVAEVVTVEGLD